MTTPNQYSNKHPQSYAAHAVSTPAHHITTTTPRSIPSPAIPRPGTANGVATKHSTSFTGTPQHAAGKQTPSSQGGAAMVPSLSQISNTSHGGTGGSSGGIGLGVSGTGSSLVGASPANLLSFTSPAGLAGLDIGTPGALLGTEGSHAMNISFSDMGMSSRKGNEDEERRAKIESVLAKLHGRSRGRDDTRRATRMGRVSEEGVRRVGCWVGMDIESESKDKKFEGNRALTIAGKAAVMIDIAFKHNLPTQIDVSFFSEDPAVTAHQEAAGRVLMRDLASPSGVAAINTSLDRFAANLETIAKLDKLSVAGQLNCFEAITGVYSALERLYEEEKKAALALFEAREASTKNDLADKEITCRRSGRPRMHARRKIGMTVEYWMDDRHLSRNRGNTADTKASKNQNSDVTKDDVEEDHTDTYALQVIVEASDPSQYPSLRSTSAWISDRVYVPSAETTSPTAILSGSPSIDWQDPPATYLDSADDAQTQTSGQPQQHGEQKQKLPNARFAAILDPPLAMPWNVANSILQSVGAQAGSDVDILHTYTSILLARAAPAFTSTSAPGTQPSNSLSTLGGVAAVASAESSVSQKDQGGEVTQKVELWVPKQEYGYVLRSIPFAHPRQIIQALPVLRQWAFVGSLLQKSFLPRTPEVSGATSSHESTTPVSQQASDTKQAENKKNTTRKMFTLAELLTPPPSSPEDNDGDLEMDDASNDTTTVKKSTHLVNGNEGVLPIDISLVTSPSPALDIVFPMSNLESGLASISVSVLADGEITVLGQNLVRSEKKSDRGDGGDKLENAGQQDKVQKHIRRMGRALEVTGDLGVWIEWLRTQYG
ncbi:hypothetical protein AAFC00_000848 [Neodothiora populina]|uniref:Mediator of RNA polymerase II transcription subunit 1 n=1 Tax=Neodothiora populina TaxID=2781224 RepID=A0ABR3PN00_9PEZI